MQFLAFVKKEFYHIFRDRRTMMILLAMPIIQIILFGFAISTEVKDVRVAVYNPSNDIATSHIIERIGASKYFNITHAITSPSEIDGLFRRNETELVIVFEGNFNENLMHTGKAQVQLIADATDPNYATQLSGYVTNIIGSYQQELIAGGGGSIPYVIVPEVKMLYNPQMKSAYNFVPGVMGLILMLICTMMTSISIVREKERGTMEVLLVSPIKPIYIIMAKAIPYLVLSMVSVCTILLLSVFVLDVPVAGSLFWLSTTAVLFVMVALSLGILISTVVSSQVAAMLAAGMGMMMPVMLLSGMIFPIESMPVILQWVSSVVPARWFISAIKKIMIEGLDVIYVIKEISILGLMAFVLITVSLKKFKYRL